MKEKIESLALIGVCSITNFAYGYSNITFSMLRKMQQSINSGEGEDGVFYNWNILCKDDAEPLNI